MGHGSSGVEMHISSLIKKQLKNKGIKVNQVYTDGNSDMPSNINLYRGKSETFLTGNRLKEFSKRLENGDIAKYNEILDEYLADECIALPIYKEKTLIVVIHGRSPAKLLFTLY